MKLRHLALIGSLFPFLLAIVLFFGVLISAEDDDGGGGSSSWVTGMNLSAEVLKHQPMVEKYAKEYGISEYVPYLLVLNAKLNKKKNKENSQNKRKSLIKVNE